MGWNIHGVVEYRATPNALRLEGFSTGEVNLSVGRIVAEALVGFPDGPILPRGIPEDCSNTVLGVYYWAVVDAQGHWLRYCRNKYTLAEAESIVASGRGQFTSLGPNPKALIADPDHFMPGWLTLPEMELALGVHEVGEDLYSPPFRAIMEAMRVLTLSYGVDSVRMVIWLT